MDPFFTGLSEPRSREQVAALPWKRAQGRLRIMLITSRGTGRWVLPKGWMNGDEDPADAALREAHEEAGVIGEVTRVGLGFYTYDKRLDGGPSVKCRVRVYPIKVTRQARAFKEAGERLIQWFDAEAAADAVKERELAELIRAFAVSGKAV
ncbi:MAG: NUDIX hydrolase [Rhizobiaceae bacterium]|jgi:8-oxo-dGTP pyrophosphatase MutT (NUDIX family)|nr:NUDIX hydrolase [Rhizobiaceae bacterium]